LLDYAGTVQEMDSTRMRKVCYQNNISIKQSGLDTKTALIDKEVRWKFSPFSECRVSFLEYWFESGYYNGFITKPNHTIYISGVNAGIDIYKGCKIKIRCAERISL
jgi:hypothetical protein